MRYSSEEVTQAPTVLEDELKPILRDSYGIISGELVQLTGYEDANFRIDNVLWSEREGPSQVIVKITNPIEAKLAEHMDMQVSMCSLLNDAGITCPVVLKRLDGRAWAIEEIHPDVQPNYFIAILNELPHILQKERIATYIALSCIFVDFHLPVRVFPVLPGRNLEEFDFTTELVREIGTTLAKLHKEVNRVPELTTNHIPFISPENIDCLELERESLSDKGILSPERAELVKKVWRDYRMHVNNENNNYDIGVIHSDFNETNLLVKEVNGKKKVSGVLDFGDVHVSVRALDIAATILYLHLSDKLRQGIQILAANVLEGYRSIRPFNDDSIVLICIRARLACSLIYGLRTARINYRGGSTEYVLKTQSNGWSVLEDLFEMKSL